MSSLGSFRVFLTGLGCFGVCFEVVWGCFGMFWDWGALGSLERIQLCLRVFCGVFQDILGHFRVF